MKYILMDQIKNGDLFTKEFNNLDEAIKAGETDFNHLSEYDKNRREYFFVLETVNPDENAMNHYDGNPVKEWI